MSCPRLSWVTLDQEWARLTFERKWMGLNRMERDRTKLNGDGIGFENTVDYCSWMANENQWYHPKWSWMLFTVHDHS
jgi:hypothetical protein